MSTQTAPLTHDDPTRVASFSIMLSGVRCLLSYVVLPWLLPALRIGTGTGPVIGLVVGAVAVGFNLRSIAIFRNSGHRWARVAITMNCLMLASLAVLAVLDIRALLA